MVEWLSSFDDSLEPSVIPSCFENEDDDHDVHNTTTYKDESKYLTTSESSDETLVDTSAALEGNSSVGVNSNSHTSVTSGNGCHGSSEEGKGSVWEVGWGKWHGHLKEIYCRSKDDGKAAGPDGKVNVFFM